MAIAKKPFKYIGRDSKTVRDRANQNSGAYDRYTDPKLPMFKVADGDNTIRILPPTWVSDKALKNKWGNNWGIELWLHNNVGADNASYLCLDKHGEGKSCPLCEARLEILEEADKEDENFEDKLKSRKRILCWIIDRDKEKDGPLLWSMPWTVEREIQARSIRKKTGQVIAIDDPDDGFDISFEKTGKNLNTKYIAVDVAREASPLSYDARIQEKWLEIIQESPLPNALKFYEAEYMEKVYMGKKSKREDFEEDEVEEEDEDTEDTEDETEGSDDDNQRKKVKAKPKASSKPVSRASKSINRSDASSEDDSEESSDGDEDEPSPPKKRKAKAVEEDQEEEEEDQEEDEESEDEEENKEENEEEDEQPKKKKAIKKAVEEEEDEEEESEEDEEEEIEEEEEEEEPQPKKKSSVVAKKAIERLKQKHSR